MCGEIEEETRFEDDLFQRFVVHSRSALARPPAGGDELNTYLDRLFADLLNRCIDDAQAGPSSDAYSRMAMQSP